VGNQHLELKRMSGYDDFHYMIISYEEHLNVSLCILEIYVVLVYEIVEYKYIDWWSLVYQEVRLRLDLRSDEGTLREE